MIDWSKPIETTDGRPARVLCTDLKDLGSVVYAAVAVMEPDGWEVIYRYRLDGNADVAGIMVLRNVRRAFTRWVNFYPGVSFFEGGVGCAYASRALADKGANSGRIACIEVTFTEGEGLDGEGESHRERKAG